MSNYMHETVYCQKSGGCVDSLKTNNENTVAWVGPSLMRKGFLWLGLLMIVCILVLLAISIKFVGIPHKAWSGEDNIEGQLAVAAMPNANQGSEQLAHKNISFPVSLGDGQLQLIHTPVPTGVGTTPMQLIRQDGPYLGLSLSEVPADLATAAGLSLNSGVYVSAVVDASPGQKAEVLPGDLLLRLDGIDLAGPADVAHILVGKKVGDVIKIQLIRNGLRQSTHLTLGNVPLGLTVGQTPTTPWLGADVQDIDAIMRIQFNLRDNRGILVSHVTPDSPAAMCGLATGDLIRTVAGRRILNVAQFQDLVQKAKPGQQLHLGVQRDGTPLELNVVLATQPALPQTMPFLAPAEVVVEGAWIGMDVAELSSKDVEALGLPSGTRGILVNDVEGPPATTVGFQSGDVITAVSGTATPDVKSFTAATQRQAGAVAEVIRGDKRFFISIPPPGYTQQGTRLETGLERKFRQVAFTRPTLIAVLVEEKDINASVASEQHAQAIILVDLSQQVYAVVELRDATTLPDLLKQQGAVSLVCGDVSPQISSILVDQGIAVYSGVVGKVLNAVALYQQHGLTAVGGR